MDIHELMMQALTGRNTRGLYKDAASAGPLWKGADVDKRVHALASKGLTKSLGAGPAMGIGLAKEIPTGLLAKLAGGNFFSEQGFDPQDIKANMMGIANGIGGDAIAPLPNQSGGLSGLLGMLQRSNPGFMQNLLLRLSRRN